MSVQSLKIKRCVFHLISLFINFKLFWQTFLLDVICSRHILVLNRAFKCYILLLILNYIVQLTLKTSKKNVFFAQKTMKSCDPKCFWEKNPLGLFSISYFRECRQLPRFIFFVLQYFGDFVITVLSRSEVPDGRGPAEMVRTQYSAHQWQVNVLHVVLVTWAVRLPWHSFTPHFVLVLFVQKTTKGSGWDKGWLWLACTLLNVTCLKQVLNVCVCSKGG